MSQRVTLDSTDMRARLRPQRHASRPAAYVARAAAQPSRTLFQDVQSLVPSVVVPIPATTTAPDLGQVKDPLESHITLADTHWQVAPTIQAAAPTLPVPTEPDDATPLFTPVAELPAESFDSAPVLSRQFTPPAHYTQAPAKFAFVRGLVRKPALSRSSLLTGMAVLVFVVGLTASINGFRTNSLAQAQIAAVNKKQDTQTTTGTSSANPPSTTRVSTADIANYHVAADLARTISIPKYNVLARVLQVGVTKDGALATPTNVYDSAWYTGSAKPGQPGATLIDGHVSSWTTNGVFYDIKKLVSGDSIVLEKGDGSKLQYKVVKTVTYPVDNVDMKSLMKPVTVGASGLNLITCGGKYDATSGEFTERVAVYAELE